jgi:hypothetical protein
MPIIRPENPITVAEREIAAILAQLERDTGSIATDIDIKSIEVTTMQDDRRMLQQCVLVELERLPGTCW